jgi:hypothetical protein
MDYEKEYKELVGKIDKAYLYAQTDSTKAVLEEIRPELREVGDEEVRKAMIDFFKHEREEVKDGIAVLHYGVNVERMIAWLEKRGEQKTVVVIPKFRVGDVIRPKGSTAEYTIESISGECYHGKGWGLCIGCENDYELVEPTPAWSGEDKRKMDRIYSILREAADTHAFSTTCRLIGDAECIELQDFLKHLKDRVGCEANCTTMWKPSAEQMAALMSVASGFEVTEKTKEPLKELFVELKKLREE